MDSRPGAARFALGVALRAAALGALAFGAALAGSDGRYATAVVLAAAFLIVLFDLVRSTAAADRMLAQFVEGLVAEGYERPAPQGGLRRVAEAADAALARLDAARAERQRRVDHLEALLDNVTAILLVLDASGEVVSANRAARQGLGVQGGPLVAAPQLGAEAGGRILALPPGGREIVRLADGRAMLAQAALFATGARVLRLVSLQSVAGDLGAVELKAWQDLVRVLSHEMMNSLTPICSMSESLTTKLRAGTAQPAAVADALEVIGRRSAALMSFIDRYRRLTDLPTADKAKVAATELAARLDALVGPMMQEAGVDYASRVLPRGLVLQADAELLEQALINLLKNALEAAAGTPGAAVRLGFQLEEGQAAIVVEDNGPGLAGVDAEAAFVPFFTTKAGGHGIGLTLARQVALAHGGGLDHAPRAPHGAVFRLWLPLG